MTTLSAEQDRSDFLSWVEESYTPDFRSICSEIIDEQLSQGQEPLPRAIIREANLRSDPERAKLAQSFEEIEFGLWEFQ